LLPFKNLPPLFIVIDLLVSFVHEHVVGLHAATTDTYLLAQSVTLEVVLESGRSVHLYPFHLQQCSGRLRAG
jgi:hypothetical protein